MKAVRLLAAFVAALWLALAPAAAMLQINELNGFNVGGAAALPSITFLQCSTLAGAGSSTITHTAQNVGTESGTRATIIGIAAEDSASTYNVTGVTVGGDSATEVADTAGPNASNAALYILSNPTGTSEDVVVTYSEAVTEGDVVCLWAVTDLSSLTKVSSATGSGTGAINLDLSATSADGVAVGVCAEASNTTRPATWIGLSERADTDIGNFNYSAADTSPTNGSSLTVSCEQVGGGATAGASAAFR